MFADRRSYSTRELDYDRADVRPDAPARFGHYSPQTRPSVLTRTNHNTISDFQTPGQGVCLIDNGWVSRNGQRAHISDLPRAARKPFRIKLPVEQRSD